MCFVEPLPVLAEVFDRQVLSLESDLAENVELLESCSVFIRAIEAISSRRRVSGCVEPTGSVPV